MGYAQVRFEYWFGIQATSQKKIKILNHLKQKTFQFVSGIQE